MPSTNPHADNLLETGREPISHPEQFTALNNLTPALLADAKNRALSRLQKGLAMYGNRFPAPSSENGEYPAIENIEWTNGFWTGQLWLAYEMSGNAVFREAAEKQVQSFADRIDQRIVVDHHDLGFLYSLSCVSAWKITGNQVARAAALKAAECLYERYLPTAEIVQAWGNLNDPEEAGRMIIDCNLNLPLLYWASEETGDNRFRDAANKHIEKAMRYLIRPDASTFHTYFMDVNTGEPRKGTTHQGFSDSSCWARGQAWGISGFPLVYRYYRDPQLIAQSARLTNYFLNRLPSDLVCYWDLVFTDGNEPRDSSAAAIAVCGMLELLQHSPLLDSDRNTWQAATAAIMSQLIKNYAASSNDVGTGLLKHGVYHKPKNIGVDEYCIWGDYFYLEALLRFEQVWESYW